MTPWLAILLLVLPVGAIAGTIDVREHDAVFVWGGIAPQPALGRARTLYVLQGEVAAAAGAADVNVVAQGSAVSPLADRNVWLVYRARTLRWTPAVYDTIVAQRTRWGRAGAHVVGVQIDFDAATSHLGEYAGFLRDLRTRLPADCRLGITGLLDWTRNADLHAIDSLAGVVDEVVMQTYQGRRTITGSERYLASLHRLHVPFKVGVMQGGEWTAPSSLTALPWFRGYVVFLRNGVDRAVASSR